MTIKPDCIDAPGENKDGRVKAITSVFFIPVSNE